MERGFSHQSLLHSDLRASLDPATSAADQQCAPCVHTAESLMVVQMNAGRLFSLPTLPRAKKPKPTAEPAAVAAAVV